MTLLLKIKNGTPPMRKSALRQITDKVKFHSFLQSSKISANVFLFYLILIGQRIWSRPSFQSDPPAVDVSNSRRSGATFACESY